MTMRSGQQRIPLMMKKMIGEEFSNERYSKSRVSVEHSNAVVGESSLDRLACALGGKTMLNYILTTVQTMLQNREEFIRWKEIGGRIAFCS